MGWSRYKDAVNRAMDDDGWDAETICPRCGASLDVTPCSICAEEQPADPFQGRKLNGKNEFRFCSTHQNCLSGHPCPVCFEKDHPGYDGWGLGVVVVPCSLHRTEGS